MTQSFEKMAAFGARQEKRVWLRETNLPTSLFTAGIRKLPLAAQNDGCSQLNTVEVEVEVTISLVDLIKGWHLHRACTPSCDRGQDEKWLDFH